MDTLVSPLPQYDAWKSRIACEVRGQPLSFQAVIQASAVRGDLAPLLTQSQRMRQCELHAEAEGLEADLEAIGSMLEEYRYARELVTIEETERWLEERGLGSDDLTGYFVRRRWFELLSATAPDLAVDPAAEEPPTWPADLLFSGDFTRLARRLACERATALDRPAPDPDAAAALLAGFRARFGLESDHYSLWLASSGLDEARLVELLHAQGEYQAVRASVLSPEARQRMLGELRGQLSQADLEMVEFDTESAAQEAYLCATTDQLQLETVAQDSGFTLRRQSRFLRDLPELWQTAILSSPPGRVLPPMASSDTTIILRLVRRQDPGLEEPRVATEIDQVLLQRHFGDLELREVRWQVGRGVAP